VRVELLGRPREERRAVDLHAVAAELDVTGETANGLEDGLRAAGTGAGAELAARTSEGGDGGGQAYADEGAARGIFRGP